MQLKIDITDWYERYQQEEPELKNDDDIIKLAMDGKHSANEIGTLAIVARERGDADNDILLPNKLVLMTGAGAEVMSKLARRKRKVTLDSGKTISVRQFVGKVSIHQNDDSGQDDSEQEFDLEIDGDLFSDDFNGFVDVQSQLALDRSLSYWNNHLPGYLRSTLNKIAVNGGDVETAAREMIDKINQFVEDLS